MVKMRLEVNGFSLPVSQMGPDFVLISGPVSHPPTPALLILQVDTSERRWNVNLPEGISPDQPRVAIQPL